MTINHTNTTRGVLDYIHTCSDQGTVRTVEVHTTLYTDVCVFYCHSKKSLDFISVWSILVGETMCVVLGSRTLVVSSRTSVGGVSVTADSSSQSVAFDLRSMFHLTSDSDSSLVFLFWRGVYGYTHRCMVSWYIISLSTFFSVPSCAT